MKFMLNFYQKHSLNYLRSFKFVLIFTTIGILGGAQKGYTQKQSYYNLGDESNFSQNLFSSKKNNLRLKISENELVTASINVKKGTVNQYTIIGTIANFSNATFQITKQNNIVEGTIVLYDDKRAFTYTTDDTSQIILQEKSIHDVICIDFEKSKDTASETSERSSMMLNQRIPDLQSLPGSTFTVYLDFDGEVVSGTSWNGGATINAQPAGFSDNKITQIWQIMAEDFRPFDINITTNRDIFEATPSNKRMMCIFTPTDTAAPGSGGVAYLNSFASTRTDNPCWTFNAGTRSAGETGSHEVGHTLGLSHDGVPGNQYYAGHGQWSPIMGWSASRPLGHWSQGEYDNAVNGEDDLAIITNQQNGFGYKSDDHGNSVNEATEIAVDSDGNILSGQNIGLITTREDKDMFSFITSGGPVSFTIEPDPFYPNLNIQLRIINGVGEEVEISNPTDRLSAEINTTLAGGTYFLEIDGVGEGNLSNGYSDYASIGFFSISGSYTPGNNNQPPIANFEATKDCSTVTFRSTSINTVNDYLWDFGDGNTSTEQNPEHTYTTDGNYTVSLTVTNDIGSDTNTKDNIADITIASLPNGTDQVICQGQSVTLTVSGSNGYLWYDQAENGTIVQTGNELIIPEVTQNQTFYVSGTTKPIVSSTVGLSEIDTNAGNIHNGGFYLVFDAVEPILLKKAKILAQGTKERTLELRNSQGTLITSKNINIPDGENIVDLDLTIPAGNDLRVGFAEGADLFRSNDNINYPYEVAGVVSIKQSTADTNPSGFYYYLYDWQVTTLGECETDTRTPVQVTATESPEIPEISVNDQTNEITTNAVANAYQWYFNNEAISGATNTSYIAIESGAYSLEVSNQDGCSTFSETVQVETLSVDSFIELSKKIKVYPNPVVNTLQIDGLNDFKDIYSLKIVNLLGQPIVAYSGKMSSINTSTLQEGVYFLVINNRLSKKFVKYTR